MDPRSYDKADFPAICSNIPRRSCPPSPSKGEASARRRRCCCGGRAKLEPPAAAGGDGEGRVGLAGVVEGRGGGLLGRRSGLGGLAADAGLLVRVVGHHARAESDVTNCMATQSKVFVWIGFVNMYWSL